MALQTLLLVLSLVIALVMIVLILLQPSQGGGTGLGSDSSQNSLVSVRSKTTGLSNITWYLGIAFFMIAIALAYLSRTTNVQNDEDRFREQLRASTQQESNQNTVSENFSASENQDTQPQEEQQTQ